MLRELTPQRRLAVGMDADVVLVDLERRVRLTHAMMRSSCGWTPFDGMNVVGFPTAPLRVCGLVRSGGS